VLDIEGEELEDIKDIADYLHKGTLDDDLLNSLAYEEDYEESVKNLEQEVNEERRLKEEALQKIIDLAKMLKSMNVPIEQIMEKTGLGREEVDSL